MFSLQILNNIGNVYVYKLKILKIFIVVKFPFLRNVK